jgi:hypothetical protein
VSKEQNNLTKQDFSFLLAPHRQKLAVGIFSFPSQRSSEVPVKRNLPLYERM